MRFLLYLVIVIGSLVYWNHQLEFWNIHKQQSQQVMQNIVMLSGEIDDYFLEYPALDAVVQERVDELSDEQLAGMILMPAYEKQHTQSDLKKWIDQYHVGGFMILRSNYSASDVALVEQLRQHQELPLFISIDAEPSLIPYRLPSLKNIPATNTISTTEQSREVAHTISEYIQKLGVNINFAPVYDGNYNTSVIGNRSYGNNSERIHTLASVFSDETMHHGIIPVAKHFPGHGNVIGDTHKNLQTINGNLRELPQFELAITDGIPMVMVGHLAITNNKQWSTDGMPASLSKKITTDLLQSELGFEGLVITDALNMGALDQFDNVPIQALKAGADIALLPKNIDTAYRDILNTIKVNEVFKKDLQKKAAKIIRMKLIMNYYQFKNKKQS